MFTQELSLIMEYITKHRVLVSIVAFLYFLPLLTAGETSPLRTLLYILTRIFTLGILAMSFDLQLARTGLLNFGQALLFGVGAYAMAFSLINDLLPYPLNIIFIIPYPFSLLLAIFIGMIVGGIMGSTTDRLRGTGFAFIALAFSMLAYNFFRTNADLSGGETGLRIPIPSIIKNPYIYLIFIIISILILLAFIYMIIDYLFTRRSLNPFDYNKINSLITDVIHTKTFSTKFLIGVIFAIGMGILIIPNIYSLFSTTKKNLFTIPVQYYLALTCMMGTYLFIQRLSISPFGRVIVAIAQNEERTQALGYNTFRYKIITVAIAGGLAALSGALYAPYIKSIDPQETLGVEIAINAMIHTLVGGLGTLIGPFLGTGIVVFSELRLVGLVEDFFPGFGEWWLVILGVLYVIIVLFFPYGIVGSLQLRSQSIKERVRNIYIFEQDYWIYALFGTIIIFLMMFVII